MTTAKKLTPVMLECIESVKKYKVLVRWRGGFWTRPGCPVKTLWDEVKIPEWSYSGNTINALIERKILIATDLNMNTATGQYYPVEVKLNPQTINQNQKNMNIEDIAQVAHEINATFCTSIGDNSQPTWEAAPEWQKSSAINGVKFHLQNPDASPSASHESWLKQKQEEGWKYGPEKNPELKEHPCFVPYDQLPVEQRSKDYLFKQIVHSLKKYLPDL